MSLGRRSIALAARAPLWPRWLAPGSRFLPRALAGGLLWLIRHGVDYWREEGVPPYLATIARWQEVDPDTAPDEALARRDRRRSRGGPTWRESVNDWWKIRHEADATTLAGVAVSPGRVTAPASVILSPADFARMEPGTILVCPTTTPAWTPLFARASGLVTDIGGSLAHGSIVAREYDIPAVMGTGNATQRPTTGQQITVDGTAGTVNLEPR